MADFYVRKDNRFRRLRAEEVNNMPGLTPWLGIEFKELGGLPVKKLYVTTGDSTYEIFKSPPIGGGPYLYQIVQEVTPNKHPFLHSLIKDEFDKL